MPIKPENRHRYPDDWPEIRAQILKRAGDEDGHPCCEMTLSNGHRCGAPNHAHIEREGYMWWQCEEWPGSTKVVLTIAHLDQQPENNDPSNLRALCQRCHLTYDATWRATVKVRGTAPTVEECLEIWEAMYVEGRP